MNHPGKKSLGDSMKKLLMIGALLPVLGMGAGFGGGLLISGPSEASVEKVAEAETKGAPELDVFAAASESKASKPAKVNAIPDVPAKRDITKESLRSENVVRLGSITVPVYRAKSVTYVVADFGVSMADSASAMHYRIAENSARLRDTILTSFRAAAENTKMKRVNMDSDWLSATLTEDVRHHFSDAREVLFLSLYKQDVPRS